MLVSSEKIDFVLREVQRVKEHRELYLRNADRIPVSVKDLQWVIQDMNKITIEMVMVSFVAVHVRGSLERYEDGHARILVHEDQGESMRRFTTVKEMSHLIIDQEDDWSADGTDTIIELIMDASLSTNPAFPR